MALIPYSNRVTTQRGGRRGDRDGDDRRERRDRPERDEASEAPQKQRPSSPASTRAPRRSPPRAPEVSSERGQGHPAATTCPGWASAATSSRSPRATCATTCSPGPGHGGHRGAQQQAEAMRRCATSRTAVTAESASRSPRSWAQDDHHLGACLRRRPPVRLGRRDRDRRGGRRADRIELDRKDLLLEEHIKELGTHMVDGPSAQRRAVPDPIEVVAD